MYAHCTLAIDLHMALSAPSVPTLLVLVLILVSVYVHRLRAWRSRSRGRPLPPGPAGLPVIGNMFNIPQSKQWLEFQELSATYGASMLPTHRIPGML